jgi:YVTN family beta-propeller protein
MLRYRWRGVELRDSIAPRAGVANTSNESQVALETMEEVKRFSVGERPYGIAVLADGAHIGVGVEGEERVKFFAREDFAPRGEVHIGPMHDDHITLSADGRFVLVANYDSDAVVAIDVGTKKEVFRITGTSAPHVIKYGPKRSLANVTCKKITGIAVVDPAKREVVRFHQLNVSPSLAARTTRVPTASTPWYVTSQRGSFLTASLIASRSRKPCCIERIPGTAEIEVVVSNIGDGTLARVRVLGVGRLTTLASAKVGAAPKRVAYLK